MRDIIRRIGRLERGNDLLPPDDGKEATLIRVRGGHPGGTLHACIGPRTVTA